MPDENPHCPVALNVEFFTTGWKIQFSTLSEGPPGNAPTNHTHITTNSYGQSLVARVSKGRRFFVPLLHLCVAETNELLKGC